MLRITLRLIVALLVSSACVVGAFSYWQARSERERLFQDLERRARVTAIGLEAGLRPIAAKGGERVVRLLRQFESHERIAGALLFDPTGHLTASGGKLPGAALEAWEPVRTALAGGTADSGLVTIAGRRYHAYAAPLRSESEAPLGAYAIVHEVDYIERRIRDLFERLAVTFATLALLIVATTLAVLRWFVARPLHAISEWARGIVSGTAAGAPLGDAPPDFASLTRPIGQLASRLRAAHDSLAEQGADRARDRWDAFRLQALVGTSLGERELIVASNREPYIHYRTGREIRVMRPASGMVTALEPVLRASGGTWVAHGSGDADVESSDAAGRIRVPPDHPRYVLKRVWLTKEDEAGYYYGFSNEGIWPLCHIAHVRPVFREEDFERYRSANATFAAAVAGEAASSRPYVWVQDFHLALVPALVRAARPEAVIGLFWHIPWPSVESFSICPWREELLLGLLGCDLIGFHTQEHANSFLSTVERNVEALVDWEHFAVRRAGHSTYVKPFPVGVDPAAWREDRSEDVTPVALLDRLGFAGERIVLGVDRLDYTKGLIERVRAVERVLERSPELRGKLVFVQIGAPTRTQIQTYQAFASDLAAAVESVNRRFGSGRYKPVRLIARHHEPEEIVPFYRAAEVCVVSSLHDGMNLVAKEYVAATGADRGALVLSIFTGASRQLPGAYLVNPYDVGAMADAILRALSAPEDERRLRMDHLRASVETYNVYRWAGEFLTEMAQRERERGFGGRRTGAEAATEMA